MPLEQLQIRTSGGTFGFQGVLHTDRRRPVLLALNGSFPSKDYLHDLPGRFPGASVVIVGLPGMLGVPWTPTTAPDMTRGLDEAIARLFGDLPIVLFSVSTGNLVGLGLQAPNIVRKISLEPFLSTAGLWPFQDWARGYMSRHPQAGWVRQYLHNLFGIEEGTKQVEERDYGYLLDRITVPTDVVTGDLPLMPRRKMPAWPSLCSDEDRARLAAHPLVIMHEGPPETGHYTREAGHEQVAKLMLAALHEAAARL